MYHFSESFACLIFYHCQLFFHNIQDCVGTYQINPAFAAFSQRFHLANNRISLQSSVSSSKMHFSSDMKYGQSPVAVTTTFFDSSDVPKGGLLHFLDKSNSTTRCPSPTRSSDVSSGSECDKKSIASKSGRRRQRVSFAMDTYGNIIPTVHYPKKDENYNEVEPHEIWWTKEEIVAIQASVFDLCDFFVRFRQDYAATVVELHSFCTNKNGSLLLDLRKKVALQDVANSSCRGLESTVVGILQLRQMRTVVQVLQHQHRLQALSVDERQHLLATQYRRNSVYASIWAQMLAEEDAMMVNDDDNEEFMCTRWCPDANELRAFDLYD